MQYIIALFILVAVVGFAFSLIKWVLFNPIANSVIWVIICALMCISTLHLVIYPILYVFSILDCIRDIREGDQRYADTGFEDMILDKIYVIKSITAFFTLGLSRSIYFIIIDPYLSRSSSNYLQRCVQSGDLIEASYPVRIGSKAVGFYQIRDMYYRRHLNKMVSEGTLVSNIDTVNAIAAKRKEQLKKLYPEKLAAKLVDAVAGDKEAKDRRKEVEKALRFSTPDYAYLPSSVFETLPKMIIDCMSDKGPLSIADIHRVLYNSDTASKGRAWGQYFIIQALAPLVQAGTFQQEDFSDTNPLDNPSYWYVKSIKTMPSIDADADPRFALDDD